MWIKIVWPNFTIQALQGALLSCTYTMLDYAQTGLIAAVFFFKVSEALHTNDVNTLSIVLKKKMIMLYYVPKPVCNVIRELNWFHKILLLVLGHIFMFMHFDMSYNHGRILFLLFNMFCRSSFPLTCYWFELLIDDGVVVSICWGKNVSSNCLPPTTSPSTSKGESFL